MAAAASSTSAPTTITSALDAMGNIGQVAVAGRRTFLLRHGVLMPKWSFVTDPVACEALGASMAVAGRAERWSGLSAAEDRIWQVVLRGFTHSGRAPDAAWLADVTKLDEAAVVPLLRALRECHLVVLNGAMASVTAAYPFCTWKVRDPLRRRLLRDLWLHGEGVLLLRPALGSLARAYRVRRHRVPALDRGRLADRQGHLRADARRASH